MTSQVQKVSPTFRRLLTGAQTGEVLVPIIQAFLWNPRFPSFNIEIPEFTPRPPDGWFHPSTHPLLGERQLYYYLTEPNRLLNEVFDPSSTMAVTQGHFWHEVIQMVGTETGFLKTNPKPIPGINPAEWFWSDEDTRSRGRCDGLTNEEITGEEEIFEFKTMMGARARKIPAGRPDDKEVQAAFRVLDPGYYAQAQEYMRMSGRRRWRAIILSLEYPFPMREIVLDYDPLLAREIQVKYRNVLQAAADQRPPTPCCGGGKVANACFARSVCPMGLVK
jgi:hypothetical protein